MVQNEQLTEQLKADRVLLREKAAESTAAQKQNERLSEMLQATPHMPPSHYMRKMPPVGAPSSFFSTGCAAALS